MPQRRRVGSSGFVYEEVKEWGQLPAGWTFSEVPAITVDSEDRLWVFCRGTHPVIILDRDGRFLTSWGHGLFQRPHDIFIGTDNSVYCVDDRGHSVRKFTMDGEPLMTIEATNHPADTGATGDNPWTVLRAGPPFNGPTGIAQSPEGDLYVTDGYGNARVHKFTQDGRLQFSWGEPGDGPSQFMTPHSVCVDKQGLVYIADRENERIQIFAPDGRFVSQWRGVRRPCKLCLDGAGRMYVTEVGFVMQGWLDTLQLVKQAPRARVSVRDLTGAILSEWGAEDPEVADLYYAPHGLAVDSRGDLYVGEVPTSYTAGAARSDTPVLHKYVRV